MPGEPDHYERLRQEYARLASRYDRRWKFYVEASIRQTLRRLDPVADEALLDVGCGTGALLEAVSGMAPRARLAGVDLSDDMLAVARSRLGSTVVLEQAEAETLPFDTGAFDVVVSTNVFHFIQQPLPALDEMHRVLKPAGRLVITDWCDDYLSCRLCDFYLRTFRQGHFQTYRTRAFHQLLVEAGFTGVRVERYKINWLWGMMTGVAGKPLADWPGWSSRLRPGAGMACSRP